MSASKVRYVLEDYLKLEKIGEGTFGVVYKAHNTKTGQMVAMKKVRLVGEYEGVPTTTIREIALLRELKHPNIVTLEEVIIEEEKLYLIFEFLSMDLKQFIHQMPKTVLLDPHLIKSYMCQILQGLCFCHQRRILHRDLKPQNLLVNADGHIKLADFGLARAVSIPVRPYTLKVVTMWYRAPELLLCSERYSMSVDIWSIGCIFAEMALKKAIFRGDSEIDQLHCIFRVIPTPTEADWEGVTELPEYRSTFPIGGENHIDEIVREFMAPDAIDLLTKMLIINPANRISAKEALRHRYFGGLDMRLLPAGAYCGEIVPGNEKL